VEDKITIFPFALSSYYGFVNMGRNKYHTGGNKIIMESLEEGKENFRRKRHVQTALKPKKRRKLKVPPKPKVEMLVESTRGVPFSHIIDKVMYTRTSKYSPCC